VVASEPHYMKHLMPIWAALPERLRGWVHPLVDVGAVTRPPFGRVALVAGWQDVSALRGQCEMIYVEHGAGQTYVGSADPSYSGSGGVRHDGVIGYIAPSQDVADRWRRAPAAAVGCPKMDTWFSRPFAPGKPPTICFAWHWECNLVPETRSAWRHYADRFREIVDVYEQQGWRVVTHFHPKWRNRLDLDMEAMGVAVLPREEDVFSTVDVLAVDNSSLGYEFASLGRPVLTLDAPWYRQDVEHGLRFWQAPPGPRFEGPEQLLGLNLWELHDDTPRRRAHLVAGQFAADYAYAYRDGSSAERAAAFIEQLLDGK